MGCKILISHQSSETQGNDERFPNGIILTNPGFRPWFHFLMRNGHGQNPVHPSEHPKMDQNGWCTYPKMVPLDLTHSQMDLATIHMLLWLLLTMGLGTRLAAFCPRQAEAKYEAGEILPPDSPMRRARAELARRGWSGGVVGLAGVGRGEIHSVGR